MERAQATEGTRRQFGIRAVLALALCVAGGAAHGSDVSVRGRVTDRSGSVGFEGAIVRLEEAGVEVATGGDGAFRLPPVPEGSYTLWVSYVGAAPIRRTIAVRAGAARVDDLAIGADVPVLDNVLVVGRVAGVAEADNRKRADDRIVDAVASDGIGQFPDLSLTDALGRIPGVSVVTEQGEGRFAVVRGLDPNLNAVSVGGARLPTGEEDLRQVPLDLIPSELVESVSVAKTQTPDRDADAIGGSIEVNALSARDRGGDSATLRADGGYSDYGGQWSPRLSGSLTREPDFGGGDLGIALAVSWSRREYDWDNVENSGGWPVLDGPDGSFRGLDENEQRDYSLEHERYGATLNLDYAQGEDQAWYLRTLYAEVDLQENSAVNEYRFDGGEPVALTADGGRFADARLEKSLSLQSEERRIVSVVGGGVRYAGPWTVEYDAAWSEATEGEPGTLEATFGGTSDLAYTGTGPVPLLTAADARGFDPSAFILDEVVDERTDLEDRETHLRLDVRRELSLGSHAGFVKFGAKARQRRKTADIDLATFDGFGREVTLAGLETFPDYALGPFGPGVDPGDLRAWVDAGRADFELDGDTTLVDSLGSDYRMDEDVDAGYLMGGADFGPVRAIAGVRVERTDLQAQGTRITLDASDDDAVPVVSPVTAGQRYTDVLPGVHLRWTLSPHWLLRGAATQSLARPSFGDLAPAQRIRIDDAGDETRVRGRFGNPELLPYRSDNLDVSLEYYGDDDLGVLSLAAFYKRIADFVVTADLAGAPGFEAFDEALVPINGDRATLRGLEFSVARRFGGLPAPWDGLLAGANLTVTDSDATLPLAMRPLPLPNQSDSVANAVLGYEKGPWSLRLAGTWRGERLLRLDEPEDPAFDVYEDGYFRLDASVRYRVGPRWTLYLDATNLGDRPLYEFYGDDRYQARYEIYGRTCQLGLRYRF